MRNEFVLIDKDSEEVTAIIETDLSLEELSGVISEMKAKYPNDYDIFTLEEALEEKGCTFRINPETLYW